MEKENYNFYAMLSRMKYINRWGLMRNTISENIAEHSLDVSILAHALAVINNEYFNGKLNPEKAAVIALFHDAPEIITGDLPTPVKYFAPEIRESYRLVEKTAVDKLVSSLPDKMKPIYRDILEEREEDDDYYKIVKAADKLSALIKCVEEKRMGNKDFIKAESATMKSLKNMKLSEVDYFIQHFLTAYNLTIDEQT